MFRDPRNPERDDKLELIFVGGLVPCKACDLALRAAAPLLRSDLAHFTVGWRWPGAEPPRAACEISWDREGCFLLWLA